MMRPSSVTRLLNRHRLPALVIVLVAVLTGLGVATLLGERRSTALTPGDEPTPRATQTAEPTESASPTLAPAPSQTAADSPMAAATAVPNATAEARADENAQPYGRHAMVLVDGVRVREWPRLNDRVTAILARGDEVLIDGGPVDVDGHTWWAVRHSPAPTSGAVSMYDYAGAGWIAAGTPDGEPFIEVGEYRCPVQVDGLVLAELTSDARRGCLDGGPITVEGVFDVCPGFLAGPFRPEPYWLYFSCWILRDEAGTWGLYIHIPPPPGNGDVGTLVVDGVELQRGDVVSALLGRYTGPCSVADTDEAQVSEFTRQWWATECQGRLLVEEMSVLGHVDLGPP
jgi:hypothetical protein